MAYLVLSTLCDKAKPFSKWQLLSLYLYIFCLLQLYVYVYETCIYLS